MPDFTVKSTLALQWELVIKMSDLGNVKHKFLTET